MALSDRYADIASYQLYAYQEITGVPPNSAQWKKVGDVRALPLPMACTLTQVIIIFSYYICVVYNINLLSRNMTVPFNKF